MKNNIFFFRMPYSLNLLCNLIFYLQYLAGPYSKNKTAFNRPLLRRVLLLILRKMKLLIIQWIIFFLLSYLDSAMSFDDMSLQMRICFEGFTTRFTMMLIVDMSVHCQIIREFFITSLSHDRCSYVPKLETWEMNFSHKFYKLYPLTNWPNMTRESLIVSLDLCS